MTRRSSTLRADLKAAKTCSGRLQVIGDLATGKKSQLKFESDRAPDASFVLQCTQYKEQLARRRRERMLIFRPGSSPFLNRWDLAGMVVLAYTALFTPFEVAFMPSLEDLSAWTEARFLIARLLDLYFTLDLFLQFLLAYRSYRDQSGNFVEGGIWIETHSMIAKNYLTSWFLFDVLTLIPSIFDIIPTLSDSASAVGGAAIFRTFRVLRFVKILRVARAGRVMQRLASHITLQHSTKTIIWALVRLVLAVHWFACIIALQASLHVSPESTWMGSSYYDYCSNVDMTESIAARSAKAVLDAQRAAEEMQRGVRPSPSLPPSPAPPPSPSFPTKLDEFCPGIEPGEWYIAAFTWALMIITGIGGTDFYPSSKSTVETVIVLFLAFGGAILWTMILADFCDVASNGDPNGIKFRQKLDELNVFIGLHPVIPIQMQRRMREYVYAQRYCQMRLDSFKSLELLSTDLQIEVTA